VFRQFCSSLTSPAFAWLCIQYEHAERGRPKRAPSHSSQGCRCLARVSRILRDISRSQRKRDRQVEQLHAALFTILDGLEQTVSKTKGTAGSKYVEQRLATESKRSRFEHGCSTQGSALDEVMDFVSKDISTSDPSELQTPIRGKENRRPRVDQRKTSIAEQKDLIMKQLLDQSKMSAAEVVAKLSKLPFGRKRNQVIRDWSSNDGRGVVDVQRACLGKRMAYFDKGEVAKATRVWNDKGRPAKIAVHEKRSWVQSQSVGKTLGDFCARFNASNQSVGQRIFAQASTDEQDSEHLWSGLYRMPHAGAMRMPPPSHSPCFPVACSCDSRCVFGMVQV
jgi:hypothetical protein